MAFEAYAVDAFLWALAMGQFVQPLDDAFLLEVDGNRAAGLSHAQTFRKAIDGHDLLGAQKKGAANRHLADRAAAPDRDGIGWFDLALRRGLPAGGENVAKEQDLLVRQAFRTLICVASANGTRRYSACPPG